MLTFAVEDWYQLRIGGVIDCYSRPDRPYTILIDRARNLTALTLHKASGSNWYFTEFFKLLEAGETIPLNQENMYLMEMRALLSEANIDNLPGKHFYQNPFDLFKVEVLYHSIFQITWDDSGTRQVGWLGVRGRDEYLQILNAIKHLPMDASLEYQKARNIILTRTGILATEVVEVGHSRGGQYYVWEIPDRSSLAAEDEEADLFPASAICSCGKSVIFLTGQCDPADFMNSAEVAWNRHKESCNIPVSV